MNSVLFLLLAWKNQTWDIAIYNNNNCQTLQKSRWNDYFISKALFIALPAGVSSL